MTLKSWSTADVSAYLDGALAPEAQVAFEAAVSQDTDLQRRITEMRRMVTLTRSVPLREPPRNYLLTPAMVPEPRPVRRRLRLPLAVMRAATAAAAAAFAITSSMVMTQQGAAPGAMMRSVEAPAADALIQKEAAGEALEMHEAPMAMVAPAEEIPEATRIADADLEIEPEAEEMTLAAEAEEVEDSAAPMGAASAELEMDAENAEPLGMGGGVEPTVPEVAEIEGDGEAQVEEAATEKIVEAPAPVVEDETLMEESLPVAPSDDTGLASADEAETPPNELLWQLVPRPRRSVRAWVPVTFGLTTIALAALTFWFSRRHRS